ncbi:MAG TPA: HD domain-containing phosphohydrolase [Bryobacteraceae bacterium]|nr:HD domain-containing phosphohydrolase [Bryobacteraceae bacterium]
MTQRILFVDDEPKILQGLERQLNSRFEVQTAPGPKEGLQSVLQNGPFAVVVSDFRMPGMNGIQFLSEVKHANADTTRVMLTGQADMNTAIAAVNEGSIFRFLTKPCPTEILIAALDSAVEQHRLITSERELLEKTLSGSIKVLTEVLSLVNPGAFSHACLIRKYATHIATSLKLRNVWECELAAMLCQLGYITVPQPVLDKVAAREELTPDEQAVFSAHPAAAERLLENIPRLEAVARMIRNQSSAPPPEERLAGLFAATDGVTMGTAILRTALEFDRLASAGKPRRDALAQMRQSGVFHARLLDALETADLQSVQRKILMLKVSELNTTMIANQNICASNGVLLLPKGEELTMPMIEKLRGFARTVGIPQPISVLVPHSTHPVPA